MTLVVVGCGQASESSTSASESRPAQLLLAGIGTLWEVNSATGDVRKIKRSEIGAGDPPHLITRVGSKLAMWSSRKVTAIPVGRPAAKPIDLARRGLIFIPGAGAETIWVAYLDRQQGQRARRVSRLREIDDSGQVVAGGRPLPHTRDSVPLEALSSGLLFYWRGNVALWDPVARRVLGGFSSRSIGDIGPAYGDLLASSSASGRKLVLSDYSNGMQRSIRPPRGYDVAAYDATFSPDGKTLAVPIYRSGGWRAATSRNMRLALVSTASGETKVVPNSAVPPGYVFTGFSDDGSEAFLVGGGPEHPRRFVAYSIGEKAARHLDVHVDDFYDFAVG